MVRLNNKISKIHNQLAPAGIIEFIYSKLCTIVVLETLFIVPLVFFVNLSFVSYLVKVDFFLARVAHRERFEGGVAVARTTRHDHSQRLLSSKLNPELNKSLNKKKSL